MPFPTDNISRFPYSDGHARCARALSLTDAEIAAQRAAYLAAIPAMLVLASGAVAAETAAIIAHMRAANARTTSIACREDAARVTMARAAE